MFAPRAKPRFVPRAVPSAPRAKPRGTYTHKTLVSASLDEQFQPSVPRAEPRSVPRSEPSVPRAEPRFVPRAEPRGTYTHQTLVSAPLDEQLERSERTHPALRAPLNMRGIYKNNAPHFCEALNHFVMSLSWRISSGTRYTCLTRRSFSSIQMI